MNPRILLVNPPIYDFSAYDFWLKPYGMLRVAGFLREQADFQLFDFLDRLDPRVPPGNYRADSSQGNQLPFWDLYPQLKNGVLKLADGCPFRCTYCSVPQVYPQFRARPLEFSLRELDFLARSGVEHIAFYDDALLFQADRILEPFLTAVIRRDSGIEFHTPNALNARFISRRIAQLMIDAGFKNIYLGFESSAYAWQKKTGGKVYSEELLKAVENLVDEGSNPRHLHAYIIVGHPTAGEQQVEESMRFAHSLGIRVMLSEFSPIPGTPDGEMGRQLVDLEEPLSHNKTYFTLLSLGDTEINRLKNLAVALNRCLEPEKPRQSASLS